MAVPRCKELLEDNGCIDEIIIFDEDGAHKGIAGKMGFISKLRKMRFDLVITFHRSMSRLLMAYMAGIPSRAGYYTRKRSWLLTESVKAPVTEPHRVEYFLNIARHFGWDTSNRDYEFNIPLPSMDNADLILNRAGILQSEPFFVINPGGNWAPKRWPAAHFAQLCNNIRERYKGRIVITGADKDRDLASEIISRSGDFCINLCGKTTLKELGAVMRLAQLVISNDSGPMHIAVSQKTPTVALFGPTLPEFTGPYGGSRYIVVRRWDGCDIPCYDASCRDFRCMDCITVKDVMEACPNLLSLR